MYPFPFTNSWFGSKLNFTCLNFKQNKTKNVQKEPGKTFDNAVSIQLNNLQTIKREIYSLQKEIYLKSSIEHSILNILYININIEINAISVAYHVLNHTFIIRTYFLFMCLMLLKHFDWVYYIFIFLMVAHWWHSRFELIYLLTVRFFFSFTFSLFLIFFSTLMPRHSLQCLLLYLVIWLILAMGT